MKKYFIATLILVLVVNYVSGQTNEKQFQLPEKFSKITIGSSTEKEVKEIFGKPDEREEIKKDQCTEIENPRTMFFQYETEKIDLMFRRKNKRSSYILDHIGFSAGTPFLFGGDITVGKSKKDDLIKKFGTGINEAGADLCYKIKNKEIYYSFLTDEKGVLVRVLICLSRNCL